MHKPRILNVARYASVSELVHSKKYPRKFAQELQVRSTRFLIDNEFINKNDQQIDKKILHRFDVTQEEYECICSDLHDLIKDDDIKDVENNVIENMLSAPLRVFLDFTYACNLRCKHCFTCSGNKKDDELSFEQKKCIIDQMVDMGAYRISLAGGEPLISKEFEASGMMVGT